MSDSEIRDAERREQWGRWRLLRDRAEAYMLPVVYSEYPKWVFCERVCGLALSSFDALIISIHARYPRMNWYHHQLRALFNIQPSHNGWRNAWGTIPEGEFRQFEEAIARAYAPSDRVVMVKSAQLGMTEAMLQPLTIHDEVEVGARELPYLYLQGPPPEGGMTTFRTNQRILVGNKRTGKSEAVRKAKEKRR